MTTRYNTRIPTQIQGKQRPPTTESSFELEKGHCFYSSTEGEARATSKTNRPKAKSKIRMFSDSGPSESINIDQASSVMYFERGRGATMPKQGTNVPCTISLDREEPLISLCDDIEEVGTEQMHEQEDLIDLENSYFLKDAEIGKTALKTKDPDRSLMSSKYAPVPTGCNVVTEPSRKVIEERTEKYGIETTSLLDDLDILTIPDTGLNCVPPPMHQSERKDDSTHCIEKSSSLDADSRWVTNAARLVLVLHRSGIKVSSAKIR